MRALVLSIGLLALLNSACAQSSAQSSVPVAVWANDAAHEAASARLIELLRAQHPVVTCSAGCTLSVDAHLSAEARTIIGEAIAREHLDVSVEPPSPPR